MTASPLFQLRGAPPAAELPDNKVLIVEDDKPLAALLREFFQTQAGCEVDVAPTGIAALEQLANARYSLVISDIRMPLMNGTELFFWLREAQPVTAKRFVFLTAHADEKHFGARLVQWGVPIVAKPFTLERLSAVCSPYLRPTLGLSA